MVVIKYFTTFFGMTNATYEVVTHPNRVGKIISKEDARRIIKREGLIVAYHDDNGIIWDTKDQKFYKEFKGTGKDIRETKEM
jgi:hypothetical protein